MLKYKTVILERKVLLKWFPVERTISYEKKDSLLPNSIDIGNNQHLIKRNLDNNYIYFVERPFNIIYRLPKSIWLSL